MNSNDPVILALKEVTLAVTASFDLDTILQRIVETCTQFSQASRGALFLYNQQSSELVMRAEKNNSAELRFLAKYSTKVDLTEKRIGLTPYIFLTQKMLILNSQNEIYEHPAHRGKYDEQQYPGKEKCQSFVGIPLIDPGSSLTIGVLKIENTADRIPEQRFTPEQIELFKEIANIASSAIPKFQQRVDTINRSIEDLYAALKPPRKLEEKLQDIVKTFKNISHADGASIWLSEGNDLVCRSGVGHYEGMEGTARYSLAETGERMGLTAWIAKSGEPLNIKSYEALIKHPMHRGYYDKKNYPVSTGKKCESFIGAPLKIGQDIIGVIKADNRTPSQGHEQSYFTEEEAHIFSYLAVITAIVVHNDQITENHHRNDQKQLKLYQMGAECFALDDPNAILWYLLTGLTHNDCLRFNRAIVFEYTSTGMLNGKMAIGPSNLEEGKKIQTDLGAGRISVSLENCKAEIARSELRPPKSPLQDLVSQTQIRVEWPCGFAGLSKQHDGNVRLVRFSECCNNFQKFLSSIESRRADKDAILAFSFVGVDKKVFLGFCDHVYSPSSVSSDELKNELKSVETFIKEISYAMAALDSRKHQDALREEARSEFMKDASHSMIKEIYATSQAVSDLRGRLKPRKGTKTDSALIEIGKAALNLKVIMRDCIERTPRRAAPLQPVDINKLLESTASRVLGRVKHIKFKRSFQRRIPPTYIDQARLTTVVFQELFLNAMYELNTSKRPGIIWAQTKYDSASRRISILISDTGTGISPRLRSRLFSGDYPGRAGGQGKGLAMAQRFLREYGGTIHEITGRPQATSFELKSGANFLIRIPIRGRLNHNRILLVEDEERFSRQIVTRIKHWNSKIRIDCVVNEKQAKDLMGKNCYDYIITDIDLTGGGGAEYGGIDILEVARAYGDPSRIIVATSHPKSLPLPAGQTLKERVHSLGALCFLSRIDEEDFYGKLLSVIKGEERSV